MAIVTFLQKPRERLRASTKHKMIVKGRVVARLQHCQENGQRGVMGGKVLKQEDLEERNKD
jgi:hypothetical protein